jgi:hypothetical protein
MVKVKLLRDTAKRKMVSTTTVIYRLTARQIEALEAGARGGAHLMRGRSMGGAKRRMIDALVTRGLLTETFPPRYYYGRQPSVARHSQAQGGLSYAKRNQNSPRCFWLVSDPAQRPHASSLQDRGSLQGLACCYFCLAQAFRLYVRAGLA